MSSFLWISPGIKCPYRLKPIHKKEPQSDSSSAVRKHTPLSLHIIYLISLKNASFYYFFKHSNTPLTPQPLPEHYSVSVSYTHLQLQKILLLDAADRNDRNLYRLADGTYRLRVNVSRLRFGAGRKRSANAQIIRAMTFCAERFFDIMRGYEMCIRDRYISINAGISCSTALRIILLPAFVS